MWGTWKQLLVAAHGFSLVKLLAIVAFWGVNLHFHGCVVPCSLRRHSQEAHCNLSRLRGSSCRETEHRRVNRHRPQGDST